MSLDEIVEVSITRETSAPTQAGFGTMLLLGVNVPSGSVKSYASLSEVADDFTSSDAEYKAAQAYFGQALKPQRLKMFRAIPVAGIFILKQSAAGTISVDINGQTVTAVDLAALATALAALDDVASATVTETNYLVVKMNAGYAATVENLTAGSGTITLLQGNLSGWNFGAAFDTAVAVTVDGTEDTSATSYVDLVDEIIGNVALDVADGCALGNEIYLVSDTAGVPNVLTAGKINSVAAGAVIVFDAVTMADILDDAVDADSDFYAVAYTLFTVVNVLSIAGWVESNGRIFATRTNSADSYDALVTTDILSVLKGLNLDRTIAIYHGSAATQYLDAALLGRNLPEDPGSLTWNLTQLALVTADGLTSGQKTAIRNKSGNTLTTLNGVAVFEDGQVASGEWIDIIHGIDWHRARMQERIFTTLLNAKKVPYTDKGVAVIEADVRAEIQVGIRQGLFADSPAPVVVAETVAEQSPADRANRFYPGISYSATLAGAIHKARVDGVVTV